VEAAGANEVLGQRAAQLPVAARVAVVEQPDRGSAPDRGPVHAPELAPRRSAEVGDAAEEEQLPGPPRDRRAVRDRRPRQLEAGAGGGLAGGARSRYVRQVARDPGAPRARDRDPALVRELAIGGGDRLAMEAELRGERARRRERIAGPEPAAAGGLDDRARELEEQRLATVGVELDRELPHLDYSIS